MSATAIAPLVLFDLDGTLVDSAPDLVDAINRLRADVRCPPLPLSALRPVVSRGGRAMIDVAFADLDEPARAALLAPFLAYYAQALAVRSVAFAGVPRVLAAIEAAGSRWGIVTNKTEALARAVVAGFGWSARCAVLIGGDTLPRKKPDPDQLLLACTTLQVEPRATVYVGDDERDILAARAAGMRAVAALWGYRAAHENPHEWGADAVAAAADDLLDAGLLGAGLPGAP